VKWFKDLKSEIKKVTWPSRKAVVNNTAVVLVTVVITSIFVGALDLGFYELVKFLYNH
jgi:preprotein translocase subunit SecE